MTRWQNDLALSSVLAYLAFRFSLYSLRLSSKIAFACIGATLPDNRCIFTGNNDAADIRQPVAALSGYSPVSRLASVSNQWQ